jgi:hypothetical protein
VRAYSGTLPFRDAPEGIADRLLQVKENAPALETAQHEGGSVYRAAFRNGATLFPRMLVFVERKSMGRLGSDPSAPFVVSRRNNQEKEPWKSLPSAESRVEVEFLHPILLGESILPYRVFRQFEGVVPIAATGKLCDAVGAANAGHDGLHNWMRKVEGFWKSNQERSLTFVEQLDYYGKLSAQFPISKIRVVYAKAGTHPAACVLRDSKCIAENLLYWTATSSEDEALYLAAIINSEAARSHVESMQSRGQWGARHFDKVMFNLPIPRFDPEDKLHVALATAAAKAEKIAAQVTLPEGVKFQRARGLVRAALVEAGVAPRIDALVAELLGGAPAARGSAVPTPRRKRGAARRTSRR